MLREPQLAGDFIGCLQVHLENGRFLVLAALVPARVDVDRHQGLGFVHDDIAAALQVHLAGEGILQLPGDVEAVENRLRVA